jgi:hypothetical protein
MATDSKNKSNTTQFTNCIDCPHHLVLPDPDPNDWFNDDDMKVVCVKAQKQITCACRPYNLRKESSTPTWCPLTTETP